MAKSCKNKAFYVEGVKVRSAYVLLGDPVRLLQVRADNTDGPDTINVQELARRYGAFRSAGWTGEVLTVDPGGPDTFALGDGLALILSELASTPLDAVPGKRSTSARHNFVARAQAKVFDPEALFGRAGRSGGKSTLPADRPRTENLRRLELEFAGAGLVDEGAVASPERPAQLWVSDSNAVRTHYRGARAVYHQAWRDRLTNQQLPAVLSDVARFEAAVAEAPADPDMVAERTMVYRAAYEYADLHGQLAQIRSSRTELETTVGAVDAATVGAEHAAGALAEYDARLADGERMLETLSTRVAQAADIAGAMYLDQSTGQSVFAPVDNETFLATEAWRAGLEGVDYSSTEHLLAEGTSLADITATP
jgi:hypothetical protein